MLDSSLKSTLRPAAIPHRTLAEAGAALAARPYAKRGMAPSGDTVRILLVNDHTIVRAALKAMLQRIASVVVIGEASSGPEAVAAALRLMPDVVVMDLDMPGSDGAWATRELATRAPGIPVLILTMYSEETRLLPLLDAGARGYLSKDAGEHELIQAIHVVATGDVYVRPAISRMLASSTEPAHEQANTHTSKLGALSARERSVLQFIAEGFNGPEIGVKLGITAKTVDTYKQRIEEKLGLSHRTAYVRFAIQAGLLAQSA
ncbi:MAG: response regulator transcription factor [bacterium]